MTTKLRVGVPGSDDDHEISARILERFTRAGVEWVRWEPLGKQTGPLAFYNGWSKGALSLPAYRIISES